MYATEDVCSVLMPLTSGGANVTRGGSKLYYGDLHPGMLRLTVPEERSRVVFVSPVNLIELVVPGNILRRSFYEAGYVWPSGDTKFVPIIKPSRTIASLAASFQAAREIGQDMRADYLDGLTQALFACLIESQHFRLPVDNRSSRKPLDDATFARCCEFADQKIGEKLSLENWAASLGMSGAEFARAFRKRTKQSPYSWFLNRKIEHAKRLLQQQDLPLAEIGFRTGFCSQSHFTDTFGRKVGCSPMQWQITRMMQRRNLAGTRPPSRSNLS